MTDPTLPTPIATPAAPDNKPGDWMENAQNLANIGHALGGATVLLIAALFTHSWVPFAILETLLAAYVLVKEFWYDLKYETGETVATSTEDALGYLVGNIIACVLIALAHYAFHTW